MILLPWQVDQQSRLGLKALHQAKTKSANKILKPYALLKAYINRKLTSEIRLRNESSNCLDCKKITIQYKYCK